jgi:hypothetical protein
MEGEMVPVSAYTDAFVDLFGVFDDISNTLDTFGDECYLQSVHRFRETLTNGVFLIVSAQFSKTAPST